MERVHPQFYPGFPQFFKQNDGIVDSNKYFGGSKLINTNLAMIYQRKRNLMSTNVNRCEDAEEVKISFLPPEVTDPHKARCRKQGCLSNYNTISSFYIH